MVGDGGIYIYFSIVEVEIGKFVSLSLVLGWSFGLVRVVFWDLVLKLDNYILKFNLFLYVLGIFFFSDVLYYCLLSGDLRFRWWKDRRLWNFVIFEWKKKRERNRIKS